MDRRRLEDAFFLFASMEMVAKCGIDIGSVPFDNKAVLEKVTDLYYNWFEKKWAGLYFCYKNSIKYLPAIASINKHC